MPRRTTRSNYPRRSQSIAPTWGFLQPGGQVAVPANSGAILGSFVLNVSAIEETVLRVRGRLWVVSDQSAAVEDQLGAFGMMVVTEQAFASGAAAIPFPSTNGGNDGWFVHFTIAAVSSPEALS